jgi:hypothetical protein
MSRIYKVVYSVEITDHDGYCSDADNYTTTRKTKTQNIKFSKENPILKDFDHSEPDPNEPEGYYHTYRCGCGGMKYTAMSFESSDEKTFDLELFTSEELEKLAKLSREKNRLNGCQGATYAIFTPFH